MGVQRRNAFGVSFVLNFSDQERAQWAVCFDMAEEVANETAKEEIEPTEDTLHSCIITSSVASDCWDVDSVIHVTKNILNGLALIAGLVAAFMWWKGSTIHKRGMEPFEYNARERTIYPYLERIGWWNKWAAVATAIAVGCSSVASFLS